jgi:hypothetical protein
VAGPACEQCTPVFALRTSCAAILVACTPHRRSAGVSRGNLVGVAPATAIFMAVYEPTKVALTERYSPQAAFLGAGALSGLVASLVRVPTEVIKQRMQARASML